MWRARANAGTGDQTPHPSAICQPVRYGKDRRGIDLQSSNVGRSHNPIIANDWLELTVYQCLHQDRFTVGIDDPVLGHAKGRVRGALSDSVCANRRGGNDFDHEIRRPFHTTLGNPMAVLLQDHDNIWLENVMNSKNDVQRGSECLAGLRSLKEVGDEPRQSKRNTLVPSRWRR